MAVKQVLEFGLFLAWNAHGVRVSPISQFKEKCFTLGLEAFGGRIGAMAVYLSAIRLLFSSWRSLRGWLAYLSCFSPLLRFLDVCTPIVT